MPSSSDDAEHKSSDASAEASELAPELDTATQERLGQVLARYSSELVNQPVPDIFLTLLAKLAAKEDG